MRINYPVKYAAMPIIEQIGWSCGINELEREYGVVCYIVAKCYLINESTIYKEDGNATKEYEIVFPYQQTEFYKWERVIPSYNVCSGYCTNSYKVDTIFNSYDEALNYVNQKNEKLCTKSWAYLPYQDGYAQKIQEKKDEFNAKLSKYKVLEQQILSQTNDLVVGQTKKLNNVIKIENNSGKILQSNIYEILRLYDKNVVVCSINKDQYIQLILLLSEEKVDIIKDAIRIKEAVLVNKTNGCYKLERILKEKIKNIEETCVFYTTETIDDLVNSYRQHEEIDLSKIEEQSLQKVKKI